MPLDSGTLTVWRGTNTAPAGAMPKMAYEQIWGSYYADQTIGIQRWYTAQQHGDHPDYLVMVHRVYTLNAATDRVILHPFAWQDDGGAYKITQIQHITDADNLPTTYLTLERDEGIDAGDITEGADGADQ